MNVRPAWYGLRPLQQRLHDLLCEGVRRTPPLEIGSGRLVIASLVSRRDFLMYLVAIKSFYARIGEGAICVINDGTLDSGLKRQLRDHIPKVTLLHIGDAPRLKVPKGGCWERLAWIAELSKNDYVIQLDSDTLTRRPLPEVCDSWRQETPFILAGDRSGARVLPRAEISRNAALLPGNHVQTVLERCLDSVHGLDPLYVRGSGGFFGVPRGALSFDRIEQWSAIMAGQLGRRWSEWGTEQASVNYLLANMGGLRVLEPPKYTNRWRDAPGEESAFIHFIGTNRFDGQFYALESRKMIRELRYPLFRPGTISVPA